MKITRWLPAALLLVLTLLVHEARAHFLFIRITPMAEGGRSAEVYFSEQAEAGDPQFVAKIAATKLWVQTEPGRFQELSVRPAADRLRASLPATGSLAVVGVCEYGVLDRPNERPFLLRHYPKAIVGRLDELNKLPFAGGSREDLKAFIDRFNEVSKVAAAGGSTGSARVDLPETPEGERRTRDAVKAQVMLEIMAQFEGNRVRLEACRNDKLLPNAVFHIIDRDLAGSELRAGPEGTAIWQPAAPGRYSIYVSDTLEQAGTHQGKSYEEVREFATLAFDWPLEHKGADPEAVALFEDALSTRAAWNDFTGFSADITGSVDGRPFTGKASAQADGTVKVEADDPVARPWLEDQLASLVMHRMADSGSDSKPVLRFGDDADDHPLGRLLVFEGGRFASSYRVKDHQITVVNRHVGRRNMTITVLENERNSEGRFLPRRYLVHYWNAADGRLERVETVQQRWQHIGAWDLPVEHTVTYASDTGLSVRQVMLKYKSPAVAN